MGLRALMGAGHAARDAHTSRSWKERATDPPRALQTLTVTQGNASTPLTSGAAESQWACSSTLRLREFTAAAAGNRVKTACSPSWVGTAEC